jgi:polyhydroxyalkanoate synthesis regulator phasin
MVKRSIQGYVELASGLGELTRAKAVEAAHELIALGSSDASRAKLAQQAGQLADELMRAAEENRRQVIALVQREVEGALGRVDVGRLLEEVQSLTAMVTALAAQVDDLARGVTGRGVDIAAAGLTVSPRRPDAGPRPSATTTPRATTSPASTTSAPKKSAKKSAKKTAGTSTATKSAATKSAAKTAKKSTATKSATKRSTTKKSAAKTAGTSGAAKSAATKSAAKSAGTPAAATTEAATTGTESAG